MIVIDFKENIFLNSCLPITLLSLLYLEIKYLKKRKNKASLQSHAPTLLPDNSLYVCTMHACYVHFFKTHINGLFVVFRPP